MEALLAQGFDLAHAFDAEAAVKEPGLAMLGGAGRGLLVGNTRALWAPFSAALRDPALAAEADPLDRYTERTLDAAFPGARIYYAHRTYGGAYVPLQHLAVATGLGALSPGQLVIHPTYGPWFALRAVVLLDGTAPLRLPIARPCVCTAACPAALERALALGTWQAWLAARDACSLRAFRYTDEQARYHYTRAWPGR